MLLSIFSRIIALFIALVVGALARWRKVLTQEATDGLSRVAIEVTLPFLYFYTLSTGLDRKLLSSIAVYPVYAIILTLCFFLISWLVSLTLKLDSPRQRTFIFLATFPNYGFLAIPLVFALFGAEGLVKIFMFNLGITFLYWTLGVTVLSGPPVQGKRIIKQLLNNSLIALLLGLCVGIGSIQLPQFVLESAKLIGNASIPLALIVVGSLLAQGSFRKPFSLRPIVALVLCRLILIPALTLLFLKNFFNLPEIISVIIILQAALPSASTTPILVKKFGGDEQLAANGVFFTTLLSMISVPLFISLALR